MYTYLKEAQESNKKTISPLMRLKGKSQTKQRQTNTTRFLEASLVRKQTASLKVSLSQVTSELKKTETNLSRFF